MNKYKMCCFIEDSFVRDVVIDVELDVATTMLVERTPRCLPDEELEGLTHAANPKHRDVEAWRE